VGAVKRSAEGSYMQLQGRYCCSFCLDCGPFAAFWRQANFFDFSSEERERGNSQKDINVCWWHGKY